MSAKYVIPAGNILNFPAKVYGNSKPFSKILDLCYLLKVLLTYSLSNLFGEIWSV